jgi:16S rRNA (uracil1498-N3)-methyltransferase
MRFFVPNLPSSGLVKLPDEEAQHAVRVMRVANGDACELFDGIGASAEGVFIDVDRRSASVRITTFHERKSVNQNTIVLGVGLPRGDRQRNVIERATELGIDCLVPLDCEYGVAVVNENTSTRMQRYVIESCKQCHRNDFMKIAKSSNATEWFSQADEANPTLKFICHPSNVGNASRTFESIQTECASQLATGVCLKFAIGPEGGFSDDELKHAIEHGWQPMHLGEYILRVETAVSTIATLANLSLGRM